MKNVSKLIGTTLAIVSLLLTACTKKPIRAPQDTTPMGQNNSNINPEAVALPGENIDLKARDNAGAPDAGDKSVVEPIYFALDRYAVAPGERAKLDAAIKWLKCRVSPGMSVNTLRLPKLWTAVSEGAQPATDIAARGRSGKVASKTLPLPGMLSLKTTLPP